MADDYWLTKLRKQYSDTDWATKPSLFAETCVRYLPSHGSLLELGAGLGQDSAYFAERGYMVTATDATTELLTELAQNRFAIQNVDLRQPLPFDDASFDVVYAHLSLHYFDERTTEMIFDEIYRVLKPKGILAFLTNSTEDTEYGTGTPLEPDYFLIDGLAKRYLRVESATQFAHAFTPLLADNQGETYKDRAKGIHNLIRFIGQKP